MKGKITREELEQSLVTNLENINSQLDNITKIKLKDRINIEEYKFAVRDLGKQSECWAEAFNAAISNLGNGGILELNAQTYNFQNTINFSSMVSIQGIRNSTKLKLNTSNKILINMTTDCNMCNFDNIIFEGLDKSENGQTGIELKGWNTSLNNCIISKFQYGVNCKGVLINFEKCYIHNNIKGINIDQLESGVFSSMISIKDCLIHYNKDGIYSTDNGNANAGRPVIGFKVENTGLEHNDYAFRVPGIMLAKISGCWFEGNINPPETHETGWILEHNRYEGKNQEIKYLPRDWQTQNFGGITEITDIKLKTKNITLSEFGTNLRPLYVKNISLKNGLLQFDGNNLVLSEINRVFSIVIEKGAMKRNTFPDGFLSFSKNNVGSYTIKFNGDKELRRPVINATYCNDDGGTEVLGTLVLKYKDQATFEQYFTVNELIVRTYRKSDNTPIDGRVMINIFCDGIYN